MQTVLSTIDRELISKAGEKDNNACREIFDKFFPLAFRVAMSYLNSEDDAKDICQTAFIKAFDNICELREIDKFGAWLVQITRNAALDHLKNSKKKNERIINFDSFVDSLIYTPDEDEERLKELEYEIVRMTIDTIEDESTRETVKMFYVVGELSTEEIAKKLNIPKSTVTTRLNRFRIKYQRKIMKRILELRGEIGK